jgi:hypothetical protein
LTPSSPVLMPVSACVHLPSCRHMSPATCSSVHHDATHTQTHAYLATVVSDARRRADPRPGEQNQMLAGPDQISRSTCRIQQLLLAAHMLLVAFRTVWGPAAVLGRLACLEEDIALLGRECAQVKRTRLQSISTCHKGDFTVHINTYIQMAWRAWAQSRLHHRLRSLLSSCQQP